MDLFLPDPAPVAPPHNRISLEMADRLAASYLRLLKDACLRIEVAGSVRRRKPTIGDLEFVCIEREPFAVRRLICQYQHDRKHSPLLDKGAGPNPPKYIRFTDRFDERNPRVGDSSFILHPSSFLRTVSIDVFLTHPDYWGWTLFVRTGSYEWNKAVMQHLNTNGIQTRDNKHWRGAEYLGQCPEEQDVFNLIGMQFVPPHKRFDGPSFRQEMWDQQHPRLAHRT